MKCKYRLCTKEVPISSLLAEFCSSNCFFKHEDERENVIQKRDKEEVGGDKYFREALKNTKTINP